MTIDDLAEIIEKTVAKKEDLANLATRKDLNDKFDALDGKIDALEQKMDEEFRLVHQEIKMNNFAVEIDDLRARLRKVEEKLGIGSGASL